MSAAIEDRYLGDGGGRQRGGVSMSKNSLATFMLRHHIQALQNTIEQYVYYAEVLRRRARTEETTTREATLRESENYGECVDRLRCAIACLVDSDEIVKPKIPYRRPDFILSFNDPES